MTLVAERAPDATTTTVVARADHDDDHNVVDDHDPGRPTTTVPGPPAAADEVARPGGQCRRHDAAGVDVGGAAGGLRRTTSQAMTQVTATHGGAGRPDPPAWGRDDADGAPIDRMPGRLGDPDRRVRRSTPGPTQRFQQVGRRTRHSGRVGPGGRCSPSRRRSCGASAWAACSASPEGSDGDRDGGRRVRWRCRGRWCTATTPARLGHRRRALPAGGRHRPWRATWNAIRARTPAGELLSLRGSDRPVGCTRRPGRAADPGQAGLRRVHLPRRERATTSRSTRRGCGEHRDHDGARSWGGSAATGRSSRWCEQRWKNSNARTGRHGQRGELRGMPVRPADGCRRGSVTPLMGARARPEHRREPAWHLRVRRTRRWCEAMTSRGFAWGGEWEYPDPGHYEFIARSRRDRPD